MAQTALVTGAASGIGRAIALGLLRAGISVAGVDRSEEWLKEVAAAGNGLAGRFVPILADLEVAGACERAVADAERALGPIDALVNNAGIGQGSIRRQHRDWSIKFWEITPEHWQTFLTVNATAPVLLASSLSASAASATKTTK